MTVPIFHPSSSRPSNLWTLLGIPSRGSGLHQALKEGLPFEVYAELSRLTGLDKRSLARAVEIGPATLQRRVRSGRFNQEESDRIYRLVQVFSAACDLFEGDVPAAQRWLNQPVRGLGGARPVEMMVTSAQTMAVLDLIGRLEHGVP